jgi:5-methylcytosine-specific restriction enzyme subunit McrC
VFNKYKDEDWRTTAEIIWDTKWKKIDSTDYKWNYGISQADMYQLFAYANNYKCKDLYLIYPKNENFTEPLKEFVYINWEVLKAIPYDLERDECILF